MIVDVFSFSPVRERTSNPQKTCESEEMTPEKTTQHARISRRPAKHLKRPLEEKLRTWELDHHFEVTAEGHLGCKRCMAHRHHNREEEESKKKKKMTCPVKEKTCPAEEEVEEAETGSPSEGSSLSVALSEGTLIAGQYRNLRCKLKNHLKTNLHRKSQEEKKEEENYDRSVVDDVPTDAQMYFAYDIVKKDPVGGGAPEYEERCREARAHGDLVNVPPFRWSAPVFKQIVLSTEDGVKMQTYERLLSKRNPVKFMCWSEDACKQFEQMMVRVVFKDRSVEDLLVKWHWHMGKSTSHEKAKAIEEAVRIFCQDDPTTIAVFKKHCKAFLADGAFAEPLAAVLVKVRDVLPFLYAGRCLMHAKQRNLEEAVNSNAELAELLDLLVTGKASKNQQVVWFSLEAFFCFLF